MKIDAAKITTIIAAVYIFSFSAISHAQAAPELRSNGKIAFTSDRDGNSEIYLMNADGSGQTRLTNNSVSDDFATWSPDGRLIAFLRQSGVISSIYLMNADGTNQTEVTRLSNFSFFFALSWSPDGTKIAFNDSGDIFAINVDGTNLVNLTNGQFTDDQPAWSPDGSRIAFVRYPSSFNGGYGVIYVMNADGSDPRQITNCEGYCSNRSPDWSPDGRRIAFNFSEDSDYDIESLSLVNPDGTNLRHVISGAAEHPKWSPDGTKIVSHTGGAAGFPSQIWVTNQDGSGSTQLTAASPNNFHPDWQPLAVVTVANLEELYAAVNNPQNAGNEIVIAPGVYMLSVNAPGGGARPNAGRIELQENMSLRGVVGNREAVVIDAINLPLTSFNSAAPVTLTAAVRMGRGTNAIEWLTVRNAVNGNANIGTELASTSTNIRIAHVAVTNSQRGIDVRNFGTAQAGRTINAEIIDNDFFNNRIGAVGAGLRIVNNQRANGGVINATVAGNRSYNNFLGLLVENNQSSDAVTTIFSSGNRFFENGNGAVVGGGLSGGTNVANGNTVSFTAFGDAFENNNGFNNFDFGGLVIPGGENTSFANGTSNNVVNIELRNCRFSNNQVHDLAAFGARSAPASVGMPGTNNRVRLKLFGTIVSVLDVADSVPSNPAWMNSVTIIRGPVVSNFDYDGDGRSDLSVFRQTDRTWYLNRTQGGFDALQFGVATDRLAPADYDGDGKTDIAVYRAGTWYLRRTQTGFLGIAFGEANDIPQPADFDGDGRAEIAVWRPSDATWYVYNLATNQSSFFRLGAQGDKPVIGDYDGDGRADYAVFRPSNGVWHYRRSSDGALFAEQFGVASDTVVPADYDGDGKTDLSVFRSSNGTWHFKRSQSNAVAQVQFGTANDIPVPGDYDGDGKADVSVFRPSDGQWYRANSANGTVFAFPFGASGDKPTQSAFQ